MRTLMPKLSEMGRIRIGDTETVTPSKGPNKGKAVSRPRRLTTFRFTSQNVVVLKAIAERYGGEVTDWVQDATTPLHLRQWQVYTEANSIEVAVPTTQSISWGYERWANRVCTFRCDGTTIQYAPNEPEREGTPCVCSDEQDEDACPFVFRLSVMLYDLTGLALWRLDTHGYYAAAETLGQIRLLESQGLGEKLIPASLRLEQRSRSLMERKVDKASGAVVARPATRHYPVVVLTPHYAPKELMGPTTPPTLAIPEDEGRRFLTEAHVDDAAVVVQQEVAATKDETAQRNAARQEALDPYRTFVRAWRDRLSARQMDVIAKDTFGEPWGVIASAPLDRLTAGQRHLAQWQAWLDTSPDLEGTADDGPGFHSALHFWQQLAAMDPSPSDARPAQTPALEDDAVAEVLAEIEKRLGERGINLPAWWSEQELLWAMPREHLCTDLETVQALLTSVLTTPDAVATDAPTEEEDIVL